MLLLFVVFLVVYDETFAATFTQHFRLTSIEFKGSGLLRFFHFSFAKPLHSGFALGFDLFSGESTLRHVGLVHHREALHSLLLLGVERLFGLNAEALLTLLDALLG